MKKYRYLLKNIGLLTLSNFATKLLSFFLVPLYTNVLSTSDYGTYDLLYTTISVLIPILTLNIQDAVVRFSLEKEYDRDAIVTVATKFFIISCLIISSVIIINKYLLLSDFLNQYGFYFIIMFGVQTLSGMIIAYTRGIDSIAQLSISSVISSAVTILLNIIFLIKLKLGLSGYFWANIIGPGVQCCYLIIADRIIRHIHIHGNYKEHQNEMLKYSRPLIANNLAWWVNNASDRYIVIFFCGLGQNGIYSVASKIPSILNVFQSIFNQAWTLSAVKDYDSEDKNGFFATTYGMYNCFMTIACSGIILFDKLLASFLYAKDYYVAWKFVPWLTIAVLFGALAGFFGGIFSAVKDTKVYAKSTVTSAITNVLCNLIMTPLMGPLGAAIATTICYIEVWAIRYYYAKKYIKFKIKIGRDIISYIVLMAQSVLLLFIRNSIILLELQFVLFILLLLLYFTDLKYIIKKLGRKDK